MTIELTVRLKVELDNELIPDAGTPRSNEILDSVEEAVQNALQFVYEDAGFGQEGIIITPISTDGAHQLTIEELEEA